MSAWIVNREHIDVMVKARHTYRGGYWRPDEFEPDEIGRMLWRENLRSVAARYPEDVDGTRPGPLTFSDDDVDEYEYRDPGFTPTAGEVFKAIGCYEYQSCETDDWTETEAYKWTRELQDIIVGTLYEGPWGWDAENVAARKGLVTA